MTDKTMKVRDILGSEAHIARTHVLRDNTGREHTFVFPPGTHVEVPYEIALRLIPIDGFEVLDAKTGRRIVVDQARGQLTKLDLKPDEVIANLEELTRDSLMVRARNLPGGDKLGQGSAKSDLVAFIMTGGATPRVDDAVEPDGVGGEIRLDKAA